MDQNNIKMIENVHIMGLLINYFDLIELSIKNSSNPLRWSEYMQRRFNLLVDEYKHLDTRCKKCGCELCEC